MTGLGLDAALFTSIHNTAYYSDFLYTSFGRPYGLMATTERITSISANIDGGQPWRRTFGDNIVYTDWQRTISTARSVAALPTCRRLGVEFDHLTIRKARQAGSALSER
jgi:creatinase